MSRIEDADKERRAVEHGAPVSAYQAQRVRELETDRDMWKAEIGAREMSDTPRTDEETSPELLAGKLIDAWIADKGRKIPWAKAIQIVAIVTKQSDAERDRLLRMGDEDGSCEMCGRNAVELEHELAAAQARLAKFEGAEIPKATPVVFSDERDHRLQLRTQPRWYWAEDYDALRTFAAAQTVRADALQAKIDALMLEFCPDEMTPEQTENWKRHQQPISDAQEEAVNAALAAAKGQA